MTKKKRFKEDQDEVERLSKENRELKSINRTLMKRLKKVDREYTPEVTEDDNDTAIPVAPVYNKCPECNTSLSVIKIAGRMFERCNECNYRTKAKRC